MKRLLTGKIVHSLIGIGLAAGLVLTSAPFVAEANTQGSASNHDSAAQSAQIQSHPSAASAQPSKIRLNQQQPSTSTQPAPAHQQQSSRVSTQSASQAGNNQSDQQKDEQNPVPSRQTPGWHEENSQEYWYLSNGTLATRTLFYSPRDRAWFYAEANGSIARNTDVPVLRNARKPRLGSITVYADEKGHVKTGERLYKGSWYFVDPRTAQVAHGMRYLRTGRKWVHYDINTGVMTHGEKYVTDDRAHRGWYYFDIHTGKMAHGVMHLRRGNKWVYYDIHTGIMAHGLRYLNYDRQHHGWYYFDRITGKMAHGSILLHGRPYYFDRITGIRRSGAYERALLVRTARSFYGRHPNASGTLGLFHGKTNPFGPCAAYVWLVFHTAGLDAFHAGGTRSGWPLDNYWWYRSRGRLSMRPQVGDFAFFWWPGPQPGVSHEGIVVRVDRSGVWVADAIFGGIGEHHTYMNALRGYGHPYWN